MIPLQYVHAEELVSLFRVADPFGFKGAGGPPFRIFLVACKHGWMIPLQYVHAEGLVSLFRVADPFGIKGSGF
jgi:hypothetical protein